jgi:hypothetical protein
MRDKFSLQESNKPEGLVMFDLYSCLMHRCTATESPRMEAFSFPPLAFVLDERREEPAEVELGQTGQQSKHKKMIFSIRLVKRQLVPSDPLYLHLRGGDKCGPRDKLPTTSGIAALSSADLI